MCSTATTARCANPHGLQPAQQRDRLVHRVRGQRRGDDEDVGAFDQRLERRRVRDVPGVGDADPVG
ncbi:MAG TPA: hypothetical protein VIJ23_14220, partial [Mycobacterium sp.]